MIDALAGIVLGPGPAVTAICLLIIAMATEAQPTIETEATA